MSDPASVSNPRPATTPKKRSRLAEYLMVLGLIGIVVVAALFQEQISTFFSMKLWDKGAPARNVSEFLSAGKKGDQDRATSYLGASEFKPLVKDGKWQGYFLVSQAGTLEFIMQDLAPAEGSAKSETEFVTIGNGAAVVTMPDRTGKPVKYRLEMKDGWKITEILGGRIANEEAPASGKTTRGTLAPTGGR